MKNERITIKLIIFAKLKAKLVFLALIFYQFARNCLVSTSWTSDFEFCETRWIEFLNEKQKWNSTCGKLGMNMSTCCTAEKDYLLQRFKRYSHLCPLEGKHVLLELNMSFESPYVKESAVSCLHQTIVAWSCVLEM